jgi:hypothetical protein
MGGQELCEALLVDSSLHARGIHPGRTQTRQWGASACTLQMEGNGESETLIPIHDFVFWHALQASSAIFGARHLTKSGSLGLTRIFSVGSDRHWARLPRPRPRLGQRCHTHIHTWQMLLCLFSYTLFFPTKDSPVRTSRQAGRCLQSYYYPDKVLH